MPTNMSYCRFENTAPELRACREHLWDRLRDPREDAARRAVLKEAFRIVVAYAEGAGVDDGFDLEALRRIEREAPRSLNTLIPPGDEEDGA